MRFPDPLLPGRLIRRYKRFLADVALDGGETVVAHCPNPGSMLGLAEPGTEVWLSQATNPARKLKYTWELTTANGHLVGINTARPNLLVTEAIEAGRVSEIAGYAELRREVRYGRNSRIDLLLNGPGRPACYVEVKNVHMKRGPEAAEFPDSVTTRGAKHLVELGDMVEAGHRAVMFFLVQRADCTRLEIAADIDPAYDQGLREAIARGVEVVCYSCHITPEAIEVDRRLPVATGVDERVQAR
ncbi:MAG: DNA/RNA nuclease SfsA [Alphaproteobacteria bacterium]|nr:MAG: DNA/RNA nuclease SfsA [Alphaproteobacteria bacterium]